MKKSTEEVFRIILEAVREAPGGRTREELHLAQKIPQGTINACCRQLMLRRVLVPAGRRNTISGSKSQVLIYNQAEHLHLRDLEIIRKAKKPRYVIGQVDKLIELTKLYGTTRPAMLRALHEI